MINFSPTKFDFIKSNLDIRDQEFLTKISSVQDLCRAEMHELEDMISQKHN